MFSSRTLTLALAIQYASALAPADQARPDGVPTITINGNKLLIDGKPMHFKGVNWNPVPKGKVHPHIDYSGTVDADGELMKEGNMNVLRTYEAITDTVVLDKLHSKGIYVMNSVFSYGTDTVENVIRKVKEVKNHPAILMWVLANEWNYNNIYLHERMTFEQCKAKINKIAKAIKAVDDFHPISTIYGHLPSASLLYEMPDIDVNVHVH
eukprot:Pgem_evm1s14850